VSSGLWFVWLACVVGGAISARCSWLRAVRVVQRYGWVGLVETVATPRCTGGPDLCPASMPSLTAVRDAAITGVNITRTTSEYAVSDPANAALSVRDMAPQGFDQAALDPALRSLLMRNFGNSSAFVPMIGDGTKFWWQVTGTG